jgi:hypothetical protein
MKEIGRYFSYEEANGWRLELLAASIESRVDFHSRGLSFLADNAGVYTLSVDDTDLERAIAVVAQPEVEGHTSLFSCPFCGSTDVIEMRTLGKLPTLLSAAITLEGAATHQLYCEMCHYGWNVT